MADTTRTKPTNADRVYTRIRADIFAASLKPGERLKFPDICNAYSTSVGVAREALARLASDRLVHLQPRLGYTVAELSAPELDDITTARVEIEAATFRLSVIHGDVTWESEILAAHHVLTRIDTQRFSASTDVLDDWFAAHGAYHRALLMGCPSRRMIDISAKLRLESELYLRWAGPLGNEGDRDVPAEHRAILEAALDRDADRAASLLAGHIAHTTRILVAGASESGLIESNAAGRPVETAGALGD